MLYFVFYGSIACIEHLHFFVCIESLGMYKNWIWQQIYSTIDYKTSFWVFSASVKICSTSQKRKGTKDIRQTENLTWKVEKCFFRFEYQWNMILSNMRIMRVSCLAALIQPSLFYVWWERFQSAFPPLAVASVSPAWNVNIWAKYFLIFSLLLPVGSHLDKYLLCLRGSKWGSKGGRSYIHFWIS